MVPVDTQAVLQRVGVGIVKRTAVAYDWLRHPPRGIVVLCYHRVGRRTKMRVDLPEWLFEEQMARLAAKPGVVDLDTAVARLAGNSLAGPDPIVVTFDDGTVDFVEIALPILIRHGIAATVYVATDFIERGLRFPNDGEPASWSALADAVSTGQVTIGSHTHTHALLDRLSAPAVDGELDRSIDLIGDRLGVSARHFAYPKAVAGSPAADRAVRARFESAALAGTRVNSYGLTDLHRLARSPIQVEDGLGYFAHKVRGGMRAEDDLRRLANRYRLAGATS